MESATKIAPLAAVNARWQRRLKPLQDTPASQLRLHEIYTSVQGESSYAGLPCTFIRTTACNLRCRYCDTRQAFAGGTVWALDDVIAAVAARGVRLVEVTGGEPLVQPAVRPLMRRLCDDGYRVLLETSGSLTEADVDPRVIKIVDLKTPSSGEVEANHWDNMTLLGTSDEVKFVIGTEEDYLWAKEVMARYALAERVEVLMGTVFGALEPKRLVDWIVRDRLNVRMQLQMHKYIWDPETSGV